MGRPKKVQTQLFDLGVDPIDLQPKGISFDEDELMRWFDKKINSMEDDRDQWLARRKRYLLQWDDFITPGRKGPWPGAANFRVPVTLWILKQMHARFMAALMGDGQGWLIVPQEKLDRKKVERIDATMRWAINSYSNERRGIRLTIDDWVWNMLVDGWSVMKRQWTQKFQKISLTAEEMRVFNESRDDGEVLTNLVQIMPTFDGPGVEVLQSEDILFPGKMIDPSNLNEPELVTHTIPMSEGDIKLRGVRKLWSQDKVDKILKNGKLEPSTETLGNSGALDVKRFKDALQGVDTIDSAEPSEEYCTHELYVRKDVDNDGFEEDLVFWYNAKARVIARWTTLDRISPHLLERPLHKTDLGRRPGRAYSKGIVEEMYPIQNEVDAMHNQRIDFGTIASIPFFFYKPRTGMKKERITLRPGQGIPLNNPQQDVYIPNFRGATAFGNQEEERLLQYAERVAALGPLAAGQAPTPAGPASTATGITSLLAQSNIVLDVGLKHVQHSYEQYLKGLHADLSMKMPDGLEFRLLGSKGEELFDEKGDQLTAKSSRLDIFASLDFTLLANSQTLNREVVKQDALLMAQTLFNPMNIQAGIITPENIYNINKNILTTRGTLDVDSFITNPQQNERPLSIYNEVALVLQGDMPRIIMGDDHDGKIKALTTFVEGPVFQQMLSDGRASGETQKLFERVIKKHEDVQKAVQAQAMQANVTGQQVSPTLGARMTGEVAQQQGQGLAQAEQQQGADPGTIPLPGE